MLWKIKADEAQKVQNRNLDTVQRTFRHSKNIRTSNSKNPISIQIEDLENILPRTPPHQTRETFPIDTRLYPTLPSAPEEFEVETQLNSNHPTCGICFGPRQTTFCLIPCGHVFCDQCTYKIISSQIALCPLCRKYVTEQLRIYLN